MKYDYNVGILLSSHLQLSRCRQLLPCPVNLTEILDKGVPLRLSIYCAVRVWFKPKLSRDMSTSLIQCTVSHKVNIQLKVASSRM